MRNLMIKAAAWKQSQTPREEGQTVVEYALVVGLVSVVIIGVLALAADGWIDQVTALVNTAIPG